MKRQGKYMTSRAALLLQALARATFGKQLHNSQNCICDDQQGPFHPSRCTRHSTSAEERAASRTSSGQDISADIADSPTGLHHNDKNVQREYENTASSFFCAVFKEIGDPENFRASEAVFPLGKAHF